MKKKIHIFGASGSGTSTLGSALSKVLPHSHLDTDDYFWATKYTEPREVSTRLSLLKKDLSICENWILSGSLCGWGDPLKDDFDLVLFLWIPHEIRIERLKQREFQRYGDEILQGGSKYKSYQEFIDWAALYDTAGMEVRSKALHEDWMESLSCPILRIEGDYSVEERVEIVMDYLKNKK